MKQSPLIFNPQNGHAYQGPWPEADSLRSTSMCAQWRYNPWTGEARTPEEIASDPHGKLIDSGVQFTPHVVYTFAEGAAP